MVNWISYISFLFSPLLADNTASQFIGKNTDIRGNSSSSYLQICKTLPTYIHTLYPPLLAVDEGFLLLSKINPPFSLLISSPVLRDFILPFIEVHCQFLLMIYKSASISSILKQNKPSLTPQLSWLSHHLSASLHFKLLKKICLWCLSSFPQFSSENTIIKVSLTFPTASLGYRKETSNLLCPQRISFF